MDIIFDIDGTLANGDHRQHFLSVERDKRDWKSYQKSAYLDTAHDDIVDLFKLYANSGQKPYRINICTGRSEFEREVTVEWLEKHGIFAGDRWAALTDADMDIVQDGYWPVGLYYGLYMRKDGDHRGDDVVKIEMLEEIRAKGFNPVMAIDDRDRVVKAWRAAGIRCIQVREGNF